MYGFQRAFIRAPLYIWIERWKGISSSKSGQATLVHRYCADLAWLDLECVINFSPLLAQGLVYPLEVVRVIHYVKGSIVSLQGPASATILDSFSDIHRLRI